MPPELRVLTATKKIRKKVILGNNDFLKHLIQKILEIQELFGHLLNPHIFFEKTLILKWTFIEQSYFLCEQMARIISMKHFFFSYSGDTICSGCSIELIRVLISYTEPI